MTDNKQTIWVVEGTTGEYSSRTEWPVCAFRSEEKAKEFTSQLLEYVRGSYAWEYEKCDAFKHPLDPNCRIEWLAGADYTCYPVELRGDV